MFPSCLQMKRLIFIFFALFLAGTASFAASNEPKIRVAVVNVPDAVTVEADAGGVISITDTASRPVTKGRIATILAGPGGLRVNGRPSGSRELIIQSRSDTFHIGARKFRGELHVLQSGSRIVIVNNVAIETYLVGLIDSEISSSWPAEAIKAQAVAARTYAISKIRPGSPYDIESTMMDQVYDGAHREEAHVYKIVESTRGQVLKRNGILFPAFYHSCCGGLTEYAHNVWNGTESMPAVEDRHCERSPKKLWSYRIPRAQLQRLLASNNVPVGAVSAITTVPLFDSPRVDTVVVETSKGTHNVRATELRRILGYMNLKSTWFETSLSGGEIVFNGRGYGHGVGMCQWGAKGMADEGYNYMDILKFYYPDAELATIY